MTRIGASQAFFNIVANFNAEKLISDAKSLNTITKAVALDSFEAMLKPLQDFGAVVDTAIDLTKDLAVELGKAGVEFEKFFGEDNLNKTRDALITLGLAFNQTFSESLAAGSRAAQVANLVGKDNVELLTKQGMILAEISDLTVEEAQKGIIKLQQQTGILYAGRTQAEFEQLGLMQQRVVLTEQSAEALDSLNTIANRSVALEGDLVQTMTNFAAQGKLAGDSFHFMAAASAVMLEAGEEAGTAGRALRMTYARLGGNINGTADKLVAMGFQVREQNGEMKSMQGILQELSDKGFAGLSGSQKQNIAQTIAGNRHYVRFIKLMENFERATVLAKEGELGLDSATTQATKALKDQANVLEIAEKRVEFYQAAIGRDMAGFMIGSTELKGDYLEVVHQVEEATGSLGKMAGRLFETMKVTGGFIKMGLAVRSLAIGMEIMESVSRAVHGIEIANRTLHSKQADYFNGRKTLLEHEKAAVKVVQDQTQRINLFSERINLTKKLALPIEMDLAKSTEKRADLEEKLTKSNTARARIAQDIRHVSKAINKIDKAGLDLTQRRNAQHQLALDLEINSEQNLKDFMGDRSATQRAMTSQLQTHVDMFANLEPHEKGRITRNRNIARHMHDGLQVMLSANKLARDGRNLDTQRGHASLDLITSSKETVKIMNEQFDLQLKQIGAQESAIKTKEKNKEHVDQAYKQDLKDKREGIQLMKDMMAEGTFSTGLKKEGRFDGNALNKALTPLMKEYQGLFVATTQAQDLMNLKLFESGELQERVNKKTKFLADLEAGMPIDREKFNEAVEHETELKEKLLPLVKEIEKAERAGAETAAKKVKLTKDMVDGLSEDDARLQKHLNLEDKLNMTRKQAIQHQARLNSSLGVGTGMLGGLIGGTKGATLSLVGLSSHLLMTGTEAFQATKGLMAHQTALTKLAFTKLPATAGAFEKLGVIVKNYGLIAANVFAIGLVTAYFITMQKANEKFNKSLQKTIDGVKEFQQSLARLGTGDTQQTTIFGNNEGLAELLGVDDVSMKELSENVGLVDSLLATITDADLNLDDEMGAGLQDITKDLQQLSAILHGETIPDMDAFNELKDKINERMTGDKGDGIFGYIKPFQVSFSGDERRALLEFVEITEGIGDSIGGITDEQQLQRHMLQDTIRETVQFLKDGGSLTQEQIDKFDEMGSGKFFNSVVESLEAMNDLIITGDEAALVMERFAREIEDGLDDLSASASEVQNLTDELSNFANAREELFFGGQYGNVTGSLYKQVVTQGVGVLYNKQEVIVSNVFHGFFNEQEAGDRIGRIVENKIRAFQAR